MNCIAKALLRGVIHVKDANCGPRGSNLPLLRPGLAASRRLLELSAGTYQQSNHSIRIVNESISDEEIYAADQARKRCLLYHKLVYGMK